MTERLRLRRFCDADLDDFVAYRSDPEVARWQGWTAPYYRETGQRFFAELAEADPDTPGQWFQFAIERLADGRLLGDCAAGIAAGEPRQVEFGFSLARAYQGQGYATEAVRALVSYFFDARGKHRVFATCDTRNSASVALLERVGMRREAHHLDSVWSKGEWTSDYVYALLASEWRQG